MRCEYCQKEFPIDDERMVGQDIKCPHCGIPCLCSDRRVIIMCPLCHRDMEGELWMLGNHAECTYCHKEILLSRPFNPDDEFSNSYLPGNYVLGNYSIKRCVGAGGMGEVYLARHNLLDRECALKLLRPDRTGTVGDISLEALIREARLACRIHSPHIIAVTDVQVDTERNLGYIVMEYVEGRDIESMICEQPLSEDFVLDVARGVCQGLIAAADYDIVHRDIKPANIMLTNDGCVKLADLGIAKSGKEHATRSGGKITGTVNYCAPEQLLASDDVDARADIYSLGASMYHMLSGRRPFEANNTKTVISKVLKGELLMLSKAAPQVSKECCRLVSAMMSMDVSKRPADAKKLLAQLDAVIGKRSRNVFSFSSLLSGFATLSKAKKVFCLSAAGAVLLLAAAGISTLFSAQSSTPDEQANVRLLIRDADNAPAAGAKKVEPPARPQVSKGNNKVDFIRLLILVIWILSGIKTMSYLGQKARKNNSFVLRNTELLNLASLVAGPIVYLVVECQSRFGSKLKNMTAPKEQLPVIVDNHGKPTFVETDSSGDGDVVYYVRKMLANALQLHASDIFIDPKTGDVSVVRFRVDGALRIIEEIDLEFGNRVINVFKVAGGMDISERRRPQDGAFSLTGSFGEVSLRVASVGAFSGEKIALRILGDDSGPKTLAAAGLTGTELATMEQAAKLPSGMVLICGPTGSGKTTTLYAMLNSIDYSIKNVISIEDPIEHVIPAISQMEVNEPAGIGFSQLLRNALRQNPDIICLGEIRDEDTAQTAIHAAQTGHLIIATLHSNDNIGTIDRLANLNIPLRSIAGTLRIVVSQRLVRKLCSCKKSVTPSEEDRLMFGQFGISCSKLYEPKGCPKCGNTGYSGRVALFDILSVDDELRELLEDEHTNLSNIQKRLKKSTGGSLMIRSGYTLAAQGITSTSEVRRVTMEIKN